MKNHLQQWIGLVLRAVSGSIALVTYFVMVLAAITVGFVLLLGLLIPVSAWMHSIIVYSANGLWDVLPLGITTLAVTSIAYYVVSPVLALVTLSWYLWSRGGIVWVDECVRDIRGRIHECEKCSDDMLCLEDEFDSEEYKRALDECYDDMLEGCSEYRCEGARIPHRLNGIRLLWLRNPGKVTDKWEQAAGFIVSHWEGSGFHLHIIVPNPKDSSPQLYQYGSHWMNKPFAQMLWWLSNPAHKPMRETVSIEEMREKVDQFHRVVSGYYRAINPNRDS